MLEGLLVDQPVESINAACLPALTVENGVVTGVIADPPLDAVRSCSFGDSSSGSGFEVAETPAPEPATAASTP